MVGSDLKTMSWESTGTQNLMHLKMSSNCLLVIFLEHTDKTNAPAFKTVYHGHVISLTSFKICKTIVEVNNASRYT